MAALNAQIDEEFPNHNDAQRSAIFWNRAVGYPASWHIMYERYEQLLHDGKVPLGEWGSQGVERALIRARMVRLPARLLRG